MRNKSFGVYKSLVILKYDLFRRSTHSQICLCTHNVIAKDFTKVSFHPVQNIAKFILFELLFYIFTLTLLYFCEIKRVVLY